MDLLAYDDLQQLLQRLGVSQEAPEFHGSLCGMLCHGAPQAEFLIFDEMKQDAEALEALEKFTRAALTQLAEPEFAPVVPDDEQPLDLRVEALAAWCGGFLYGLGASKKLDTGQLSEEVQELLRDFTEISRADVTTSDDDDTEDEERAYAELIEYVRVGAQVIFLETHPRPDLPPSADGLSDDHTLH